MKYILPFLLIAVIACESKKEQLVELKKFTPEQFNLNEKVLISTEFSGDVDSVEYYFMEEMIGKSNALPYTIEWEPKDILPGPQQIISIAYISGESEKFTIDINISVTLGTQLLGGVVFSYNSSNNSGLIVSNSDFTVNGKDHFSLCDELLTNALSKTDGFANTEILAQSTSNENQVCFYYPFSFHGFDDWYIPALDELTELRNNNTLMPGLPEKDDAYYWTSTCTNRDIRYAYGLNIYTMADGEFHKPTANIKVRLIRKFGNEQ